MIFEAKKYFKYLQLVREEFGRLGISAQGMGVCDYGCGTGITTFGLEQEVEQAEYLGVDLFETKSSSNLKDLDQHKSLFTISSEHGKPDQTEQRKDRKPCSQHNFYTNIPK
jgi:hypothetical protein